VVVLNGCGTWSIPLREEHRLRVFESGVLREVCVAKGDGVTGEWRRLQDEKLRDLYCSPDIALVIELRRMRWAGHVAGIGDMRGVYRVLVGKLREREYLFVDGRVMLQWIVSVEGGGWGLSD
jgi:hypothetical protein